MKNFRRFRNRIIVVAVVAEQGPPYRGWGGGPRMDQGVTERTKTKFQIVQHQTVKKKQDY